MKHFSNYPNIVSRVFPLSQHGDPPSPTQDGCLHWHELPLRARDCRTIGQQYSAVGETRAGGMNKSNGFGQDSIYI